MATPSSSVDPNSGKTSPTATTGGSNSRKKKKNQGPKPLDEELKQSFMAQKSNDLVARQNEKVRAKAEAFTFTSTFEDGAGARGESGWAFGGDGTIKSSATAAAGELTLSGASARRPPDNFEITARSATAGSYFKKHNQSATVHSAPGGAGEYAAHDQQQEQNNSTVGGGIDPSTITIGGRKLPRSLQGTHGGNKTNGSGKFSRSASRLPPLDRQAELEEQARQRALQALIEQEEEDRLRHEACQIQRQVERLKLQQRTKARIEKQLLASQRPMDKAVSNMGIDVDEILSRPKDATYAAQHRAELKDEPNATFIRYNMTRMQHNMAHRQYCINTLQERQRMRMGLEKHCQAYYPKKKEKQLQAIGASVEGACRFPTVAELHAQQKQVLNAKRREEEDDGVTHQQTNEVSSRDDELWEERCARYDQGLKEDRVREIPYDVNRKYVKRAEVKPPHFPAKVHSGAGSTVQ